MSDADGFKNDRWEFRAPVNPTGPYLLFAVDPKTNDRFRIGTVANRAIAAQVVSDHNRALNTAPAGATA